MEGNVLNFWVTTGCFLSFPPSFPSSLRPPLPKRTTFNTLEIDVITKALPHISLRDEILYFPYLYLIHEGTCFSPLLMPSSVTDKGLLKAFSAVPRDEHFVSWVSNKAFCFHLHINIVNYHSLQLQLHPYLIFVTMTGRAPLGWVCFIVYCTASVRKLNKL